MITNNSLKHIEAKNVYLFCFSLFFYLNINGQTQTSNATRVHIDWDVCQYHPAPATGKTTINVPDYILEKTARGGNCSTFFVSYTGFTPEAEAAFQFAVDIWSNLIESSVPIRVSAEFGPLDDGVLGGAGPAGFVTNIPGFPADVAFAAALGEHLLGEDSDGPFGTTNDINATFSSTANFYFGTDGNTPSSQVDFVSVVLHELGHGLGMLGFGRTDNSDNPTQGILRNVGFISAWDQFIENGSSTAITDFTDPSAELLSEITGNNLFSNGLIATAQNGGTKPSTYAPSTYSQGSSYSHWDEGTYPPGNANSLMTPSIGPGEAIHDPGLVTLGFMEDMGWNVCGGTLSVSNFNLNTIKVSPNPFKSSITIQLDANSNDDDFNVSITDMNGRQILNINKSTNDGKLTISNLGQLENALYFVKITNTNTGFNTTKKLVKN